MSLFLTNYNFISFDHSDHFGVVSNNGIIIWNEDWHSSNLLFDGTGQIIQVCMVHTLKKIIKSLVINYQTLTQIMLILILNI